MAAEGHLIDFMFICHPPLLPSVSVSESTTIGGSWVGPCADKVPSFMGFFGKFGKKIVYWRAPLQGCNPPPPPGQSWIHPRLLT